MTEATISAPSRLKKMRGFLWRTVVRFLAVVGLLSLIFHTCFSLEFITSPSMAPTLNGSNGVDGDWVLSEKISYWFRSPKRWEVVRYFHRDGFYVMKRIVAMPGETIGIRDGSVVIDGETKPFPEKISTLHYYPFGVIGHDRDYTCNSGYFVLGDDSRDSVDSRYEKELPQDQVLGRAWLIVWPLERFDFVTP